MAAKFPRIISPNLLTGKAVHKYITNKETKENILWECIHSIPVIDVKAKHYRMFNRILGTATQSDFLGLDISSLRFGQWKKELKFVYMYDMVYSSYDASSKVVMPIMCAFSPDSVTLTDEEILFKWE